MIKALLTQLIIVGILAFGTSSAKAECAASDSLSDIFSRSNKFDSQKLLAAGRIIRKRLSSEETFSVKWGGPNVGMILSDLTDNYISSERIFQANSELRRALCIPKLFNPPNQGRVKETRSLGFYIPEANAILIDPDIEEYELPEILLHEITHAFQYLIRLPIDLHTLRHDQGSLNVNLSHMAYFYETQAHWYALSLLVERDMLGATPWIKWGKRKFPRDEQNVLKNVATGLQMLFAPGLWNHRLEKGRSFILGMLPEVDSAKRIRRFEDTFLISEYIPLPLRIAKRKDQFININIKFHQRLGTRIEQTYYGKLAFLGAKDASFQLLATELHNNFYARINTLWDQGRCQNIIANASRYQGDLIEYWKSFEHGTCPLYEGIDISESINFLIKLKQRPLGEGPFRINFAESTEGGGPPNINIQPGFDILPNLEIKVRD